MWLFANTGDILLSFSVWFLFFLKKSFIYRFFSNLVGEEGSRIQGVKGPSVFSPILEIFLLFYKDPNRVCTTFAKLSDLRNS